MKETYCKYNKDKMNLNTCIKHNSDNKIEEYNTQNADCETIEFKRLLKLSLNRITIKLINKMKKTTIKIIAKIIIFMLSINSNNININYNAQCIYNYNICNKQNSDNNIEEYNTQNIDCDTIVFKR